MNSKKFPSEEYFAAIEKFKATLVQFADDDSVDSKALVLMLCGTLDTQGTLLTHVLEHNADIGDELEWEKYLKAAAWLIYQRYVREVESTAGASSDG